MEAFYSPYIALILLLFPLSLYLIAREQQASKNLPPGSKGWPVLGENMAYAFSGPQKFIRDRMEKHSPDVFRTSLFGVNVMVFAGAQGNRFLFANEGKLVQSWWPESIRKALLFPEYVQGDSKEIGGLLHRFLHDILKPEALKHYVPVMDEYARKHLDGEWAPGSVVRVLPSSKKYTFDTARRLFLGLVEPERAKRLEDSFSLVINGLFSVPIDLPGTAYKGAVRGGRLVREELVRIIRERRRELLLAEKEKNETPLQRGIDLLSKMVLVRGEDGELFNEMEIAHSILGVLVASYDTTSSLISSVLSYLAELPRIYDEVFKEQMEIAESKGPGELLTWEDIEKMKYSWNVARESLRLMPPSQGAFRETTAEVSYAGFTIPKGWKAFWTVHSTHKNPKYFPDPEKFDPSRFEGSGPAPYTFVPFGGGPRICPGREYARLELLVFIHNVVTRFKLRKAVPNEKIVYHASPTPAHGLPMHLQPHDYNKRITTAIITPITT